MSNYKELKSRDGYTIVLFSYDTPVLVHTCGSKPIVTEKEFSVSTTRHINKFIKTHFSFPSITVNRVPQEKLVEEVQKVLATPGFF